jgi:hypothetical protein
MTDVQSAAWTREESVEARADAAFAFRYWTTVENMTKDPGIERVETDGPRLDQAGMRGRTHLAGGGTTDWVVSMVEPDRRFAIDVALPGATLRFELRFEAKPGGGSILTQRVSLFGPNAAAHRDGVEAGFGGSLRDGMRAVRDRIDAAADHA